MTLEEYQKQQLEAVVFCYDLLKAQGLLRGFACLQDTRAYTESFVSEWLAAFCVGGGVGGGVRPCHLAWLVHGHLTQLLARFHPHSSSLLSTPPQQYDSCPRRWTRK